MVNATEFRKACGVFPTGVTVVTRWHKGEPLGVTVSAFTSVSLDPPLVLVCVRMGSTFLEGITDGDPIFINMLASHQSGASDRFSRLPPPQRFCVGDWEQLQLKEALAVMACRLHRSLPAGDHALLMLSVEATFALLAIGALSAFAAFSALAGLVALAAAPL